MSPEDVKNQIAHAFADGEYPGDQRLAGSIEGDEPALLASEFRGKTDWRALDAAFLDAAPDGFSSALSFYSDEALRFYLPAYLLASIDERLESVEPVFHLIRGLTNASRDELVNPRRYGDRTWFRCAGRPVRRVQRGGITGDRGLPTPDAGTRRSQSQRDRPGLGQLLGREGR